MDIHGAFIRRVDLTCADLERVNLARADASNAVFRGADLKDAILTGTILKGADLREAENLTWEQLSEAVIDEATLLPDYLVQGDHLSSAE